MSFNVNYNGVVYVIPEQGDNGWGPDVTSYLNALSTGSVTKSGGLFPLLADIDFGSVYGISAGDYTGNFFAQYGPNAATSGVFRLRNNESISWRNSINTVDLGLSVNASDELIFNGAPIGATTVWGSITGTLSDQTDLQAALDLKAPLASPTFTGTVGGITKSMVGLGNVDNTADTAKPISTLTQAALDLKLDIADVPETIPNVTYGQDAQPAAITYVIGNVGTGADKGWDLVFSGGNYGAPVTRYGAAFTVQGATSTTHGSFLMTGTNLLMTPTNFDFYGDFSADNITGPLTGNADTATALETARLINGVAFDGTANITVPAGGIPVGGTTGQVLAKIDGVDYNTEWVTTAAGTPPYSVAFGDGTTGPFVITHNLGTRDVFVSLRKTASPYNGALVDWEATTTNTITLFPDVAIASNAYTVTVQA